MVVVWLVVWWWWCGGGVVVVMVWAGRGAAWRGGGVEVRQVCGGMAWCGPTRAARAWLGLAWPGLALCNAA